MSPSPRFGAATSLFVFVVGIGMLGLSLSESTVHEALSAAVTRRITTRGRSIALPSTRSRLRPAASVSSRAASSAAIVCKRGSECLPSTAVPPCFKAPKTCTPAKKGEVCRTDGNKKYVCFSCPAGSSIDSSHHQCK